MKQKNILKIFQIFLVFAFGTTYLPAQNPFITHIYAADPSAHVWPNDTNTLWLYTSHDEPGTNHHATMFDYHVFSTKDLVHWIDHGRVLSVDDVDWAINYAWAIDAVYRHNKYYLIFCMHETSTGIFRTGVAVSDVPQGPFTNIGYIKGVEWGQDPCVFVDDDNRAYLYWGSGGSCYGAELNDDLLSIKPETKRELTKELFEVFEGPWVHKYNGKYYLSYPGLPGGKWPEEMYYAIADKPLGPFKYMGKYIPRFEGQAGTNHGSIVKFKGKWIAFHHSMMVSGVSEQRSLMADFLYYNPDGTIKPIVPSPQGISEGKETSCIVLLEAENGKAAGGRIFGPTVKNESPDYSGKGYVTDFNVRHYYVEVLAQVAKDMKANLKIRLSSEKDFNADILVGNVMLASWNGLPMKKTNGWEEVDLGTVQLKAGNNRIRFTSINNPNVKVDYFLVIPEKIK
jgi:hypothetical protein